MPEAQRSTLAPFIQACERAAPEFRWVPPANLHLTMRFVGHVERALVESVADRLAEQAPQGFEVALGRLGTFGRGGATRVVWLALDSGSESCSALAAQVERACRQAGLAGEEREFTPHLTLGRARGRTGRSLPALPPTPPIGSWRAGSLVLYRSRLGRPAAVYEPLRVIPLQGG